MEKIIKRAEYLKDINPAVVSYIAEKRMEENKPDKFKAMQTLIDSGMTCREVASVMGTTMGYVAAHTHQTPEQIAERKRIVARKMIEARLAAYRVRKAYYTPIMQELRNRGFSNAEIAVKTGFTPKTVDKYIGKQPDEITLASYRIAGAKRRLRNLAVRNQAARDKGDPIPSAKVLKTA